MPLPRRAPIALACLATLALAGCGSDYPAEWPALQRPLLGACPPLEGAWPLPDGAPPLPGLPADDAGQPWTTLQLDTPSPAEGGLEVRLRAADGNEHRDAWPEGRHFTCADGMLVMPHPGQPGATLAFAMSGDDALVVRAQAARGEIVSPWCGVGCTPAAGEPARTRWHRWTRDGAGAATATAAADAEAAGTVTLSVAPAGPTAPTAPSAPAGKPGPAAKPDAAGLDTPVGDPGRRPTLAEQELALETGRPLAWQGDGGSDAAALARQRAMDAERAAMEGPPPPARIEAIAPPAAPVPDARTVEARLRALLPGGVRLGTLRLEGGIAFFTLDAPSNRQVSETLRAIDGDAAFRGVELVQIEMRGAGVHAQVRVAALP